MFVINIEMLKLNNTWQPCLGLRAQAATGAIAIGVRNYSRQDAGETLRRPNDFYGVRNIAGT